MYEYICAVRRWGLRAVRQGVCDSACGTARGLRAVRMCLCAVRHVVCMPYGNGVGVPVYDEKGHAAYEVTPVDMCSHGESSTALPSFR